MPVSDRIRNGNRTHLGGVTDAEPGTGVKGTDMRQDIWIQKTHLFSKDQYICSACRAVCDEPYQVCPACGAEKSKVTYDASWVDEAEKMSILLDEDW